MPSTRKEKGKNDAMKLVVVRHSDALDVGQCGISTDEARILSDAGRKKAEEVARGLALMGCRPNVIAASPLARAMETAEIIAKIIAPGTQVQRCDILAPGATASRLLEWLRKLSADTVMVVGHMPDTACIASELIAGKKNVGILFKKCGCCSIAFDEAPSMGAGVLEWLMQPQHLRRIS